MAGKKSAGRKASVAKKAAVKKEATARKAGSEAEIKGEALDVEIEQYESTADSAPIGEPAGEKERSEERMPVSTVAQLQAESIRQNKPVSQEQLDEVKKVEAATLEEGAKEVRVQEQA